MKILTKKEQGAIIQRLAANHVISANAIHRLGRTTEMSAEEYVSAIHCVIDNTCTMAKIIGGIDAMKNIKEMIDEATKELYGNEIQ